MDTAERILREIDTIAVVGASRSHEKAAHYVPAQLKAAGFRVVPVNPHADVLFGERVYRTLSDIPFPIDLVLVFRPSAQAAAVARDALAIGAKALWLQQGIHSHAARRAAEAAGVAYVEDTCAAVVRAQHRIEKPRAAD
jgi:predicted CoA-binding protein